MSKLTLDEAIKYNLDIADGQDKCADISVSEHAKERMRECAADHRQLAEWLMELKEAKWLLKLALQDLAEAEHCGLCKYDDDIPTCQSKPVNCFVWRYADEALKLIGGSENE